MLPIFKEDTVLRNSLHVSQVPGARSKRPTSHWTACYLLPAAQATRKRRIISLINRQAHGPAGPTDSTYPTGPTDLSGLIGPADLGGLTDPGCLAGTSGTFGTSPSNLSGPCAAEG
jgi:hypothetical protein